MDAAAEENGAADALGQLVVDERVVASSVTFVFFWPRGRVAADGAGKGRVGQMEVPYDIFERVLERVLEDGDVHALCALRRVNRELWATCEEKLRRLARRLRSSDVSLHFPGLTVFAQRSFCHLPAWPRFAQMRFAQEHQCSICYQKFVGGFRKFYTGGGGLVLLHAHDACLWKHTVAVHYVATRAYYEPNTARGRKAIERVNAASERLIPCLLARPCAGLRDLQTVAYTERTGYMRYFREQFSYDVCLADRVPNVPREYTLLGALFDSEAEIAEAVDAFHAWGGVVNRALALKGEERTQKLARAIEKRGRWMRAATGLTSDALRGMGVLHLRPFAELLGDAASLRVSASLRGHVQNAARILPEFVRCRDDLVREGAIRVGSEECVSQYGIERMRAAARKRFERDDRLESQRKQPRGPSPVGPGSTVAPAVVTVS